MKVLIILIALFLVSLAHAKKCEVYGISDSPQKLKCIFKNLKISLTCQNGIYFLNTDKVNAAYHYDVEYGSVPLVFETADEKLIVVMEPKVDIEAELERKGRASLIGTCL
jgi:hypothetical protein